MFDALMDWVMADVGRALWVMVVLMWAVVASAILVLALSWREKWAADDPETDLSDWPETKPMLPLYGSQSPVTETMEADLTAPTGPRMVAGRARSAWLDD